MPTIPSGVNKQLIIAKESVWGTAPATNTGKRYRRTSLDLNLSRASYESAEISSTAQTSNMRNGSDTVEGSLEAELSPGSYQDLFAALLRGPWTTGVTYTAATIAAAVTANTLTRSAGSWITDGYKIGDSVAVSGFTTTGVPNNVTAVITALTATVMTLDAVLATKAAGDSVTVAVVGKKLIIPIDPASRTNDSFIVEQWFDSISVSRLATGVKVSEASISIQPNAMSTVSFGLMGKDITSSGTAYFVTPTAASTTSTLTGSAGALYIGGTKIATVTGLTIEISSNSETGVVIGSRSPADIFRGRITVSGSFTAYFVDDSMFTLFKNETESSLVFKLIGDGTDALVIKLPRIKFSGASVDDNESTGIIQTVPFTALLGNGVSTTVEQSTIVLQDSAAV